MTGINLSVLGFTGTLSLVQYNIMSDYMSLCFAFISTTIFSYSGGFLVGSGDGTIDLDIEPDTSIQTSITFNSPDFDTDPPSDAGLSCTANVETEGVEFGSFLLDRFVAPTLPGILSPLIEPLICLPFQSLETILADILVMITEVINEFGGTLTPEQTDNLYPNTFQSNNRNPNQSS